MKLILKQAVYLLVASIAAFAAFWLCSFVIARPDDISGTLDSARSPDTLFTTQPKYVFMARGRLDTPADKVILVGASNTMAGFKTRDMQPRLPNFEVHNVSVGGSNMTQIAQVTHLIREVQTPEARQHSIYVFGLWYGVFASDAARWNDPARVAGDTDMDIERYRYGFYRRTADGPVAVLPPEHLGAGVLLVHPFLVLDSLARDATRGMRRFFDARPAAITDEQRDAVVVGPARQQQYLAFWRDYTAGADTLEAAQFAALTRAVNAIVSDGGRVLLVDLPIPAWHTAGSVLAANYRRQMDDLLPQLRALPGVDVLDMTDASASDDFNDEVHPKPRVAPLWAARLATAVARHATAERVGTPPPGTGKRL